MVVQWSSAHIHLAEYHDHDGSHHLHASQGHLHGLNSHHVDAIDVSHTDDHGNVVELDQECTSPHWYKWDSQSAVLAQGDGFFEHQPYHETVRFPLFTELGVSWLSYTTVRLRAPPHKTS